MFCDIIVTWCKTSCDSSYCTGVIIYCVKMLKIPFVFLLIALYFCLVTSRGITLVKCRGMNGMVLLPSCPALPSPVPAKTEAHSRHDSCSALWCYIDCFWFYTDFIRIYLKAWGPSSRLESLLLNPRFSQGQLRLQEIESDSENWTAVNNVRVFEVLDPAINGSTGEGKKLHLDWRGGMAVLLMTPWHAREGGTCYW